MNELIDRLYVQYNIYKHERTKRSILNMVDTIGFLQLFGYKVWIDKHHKCVGATSKEKETKLNEQPR